MQKRLTKKEHFFNNINLTSDDEVYVGIDVHKVKYHIAIWLNEKAATCWLAGWMIKDELWLNQLWRWAET